MKAVEAMKLAREKNYTLIFGGGGDMNARNTLYGSKTTDTRGKKIEDLMVEYDLQNMNKGNQVTCTSGYPGSVIDATFINGEKEHLVKD